MSLHEIIKHPFSSTWKKALVSLPRIVPDATLRYTSPAGPQPFKVKLPAFHPNHHDIPVYIFVYLHPREPTNPPSRPSSRLSHRRPRSRPSSRASSKPSSRSTSPHQISQIPSEVSHSSSLKPIPSHLCLSQTTSSGVSVTTLNLPVLIDFHGGSFILGTPQEQAPFCSQMVREIGASHPGGGAIAISVDYRLGPYAQYPAANEDAQDIVRAVLERDSVPGRALREAIRHHASKHGREEWVDLDENHIALSGFSSGGNLALNLALSVKDDPTIMRDWPSPIPQNYQPNIPVLLFYPSLDSRLLPDERPRPPGLEAPAGFFASLKIESELMPQYLHPSKRHHPRASPGLASLGDGGLHPKAKLLLILPELDSLSSQSLVWVEKVEKEGRLNDLEVIHVPKVMHGWTQFPDSWLKSDDQRQKKQQVFDAARDFLQKHWLSET